MSSFRRSSASLLLILACVLVAAGCSRGSGNDRFDGIVECLDEAGIEHTTDEGADPPTIEVSGTGVKLIVATGEVKASAERATVDEATPDDQATVGGTGAVIAIVPVDADSTKVDAIGNCVGSEPLVDSDAAEEEEEADEEVESTDSTSDERESTDDTDSSEETISTDMTDYTDITDSTEYQEIEDTFEGGPIEYHDDMGGTTWEFHFNGDAPVEDGNYFFQIGADPRVVACSDDVDDVDCESEGFDGTFDGISLDVERDGVRITASINHEGDGLTGLWHQGDANDEFEAKLIDIQE